jgi:hypothetical protein
MYESMEQHIFIVIQLGLNEADTLKPSSILILFTQRTKYSYVTMRHDAILIKRWKQKQRVRFKYYEVQNLKKLILVIFGLIQIYIGLLVFRFVANEYKRIVIQLHSIICNIRSAIR